MSAPSKIPVPLHNEISASAPCLKRKFIADPDSSTNMREMEHFSKIPRAHSKWAPTRLDKLKAVAPSAALKASSLQPPVPRALPKLVVLMYASSLAPLLRTLSSWLCTEARSQSLLPLSRSLSTDARIQARDTTRARGMMKHEHIANNNNNKPVRDKPTHDEKPVHNKSARHGKTAHDKAGDDMSTQNNNVAIHDRPQELQQTSHVYTMPASDGSELVKKRPLLKKVRNLDDEGFDVVAKEDASAPNGGTGYHDASCFKSNKCEVM
ncbi:hypothetical protein K490DRAFT_56033 [Saccharata proteae CBS 121410]|uniref:Uncharacterized protein n=1 Tax=Saccharata proteae CBS 121410 TaxID=1314787 RepID=A0A9P4I0K8_9PEZI|nr:hypothetical protein K490DRAFT_56033 [Saccharata proteae CBS 121410]